MESSLYSKKSEIARKRYQDQQKKQLEEFNRKVFIGFRYPKAIQLRKQKKDQELWDLQSPKEKQFIATMGDIYPSQAIGALILMPNTDDSHSGDIGGYALNISTDSKFSPATVLSEDEPFGHTMLCRIHNDGKLNDEMLKTVAEKNLYPMISELISSASDKPLSIANHFDKTNPHTDLRSWTPILSGPSSRVGIYSTTTENGAKAYTLIAHSSAGAQIGKELFDIALKERPTVGEFIKDPRVKWAKQVGYRNTAYLLQHAAKQIGVSIDSSPDLNAKTGEYESVPYIADPNADTEYNTFSKITDPSSGKLQSVVFFKNCGSGSESHQSALIVSDHMNHITEVEGRHSQTHFGDGRKPISNEFFGAIPSHTSDIPSEKAAMLRSKLALAGKSLIANSIFPISDSLKSQETLASSSESAYSAMDKLVSKSYANKEHFNDSKVLGSQQEYKKSLGLGTHPQQTRFYNPIAVCIL